MRGRRLAAKDRIPTDRFVQTENVSYAFSKRPLVTSPYRQKPTSSQVPQSGQGGDDDPVDFVTLHDPENVAIPSGGGSMDVGFEQVFVN